MSRAIWILDQERHSQCLHDPPIRQQVPQCGLYDRVLEDPQATVHRKGGVRYQVRSPHEGWIAIVESDGLRVSVYPDLDDDLGDAL